MNTLEYSDSLLLNFNQLTIQEVEFYEHLYARNDFAINLKQFHKNKLISNRYISANKVCYITSLEDIYVTYNSFCNYSSAALTNLKYLNAIVLDIDYYNIERYKSESEKVIMKKVAKLSKVKPSAIVFTGKGLAVYYFLNDTYSTRRSCEFIKEIINSMNEHFKELGADMKCSNPNRITRLLGSINSKTNKKVELILADFEQRYTLQELANAYLGDKRQVIRPPRVKTDSKKVKTLSRKKHSVSYSRYKDMCYLIQERVQDSSEVGSRNEMLFHASLFYYQSYCKSKTSEESYNIIYNEITRLNIHALIDESTVEAMTRSIIKNASKYEKYKTETIIKKLNITKSEEQHLVTLISKEELSERRASTKRQKYHSVNERVKRDELKKNRTLSTRAIKKQKLLNEVTEMLNQNTSINRQEICEVLNISDRYLRKLIQEINNKA